MSSFSGDIKSLSFRKGASIKSLAVASGKGGTGKSIIVASLGYLLAHCGFKTLIVDMDLFTSGLTFYSLAEYPRLSSVSIREVFTDDADVKDLENVQIPHPFCDGNLFILPSVSGRRRKVSELQIGRGFDDIATFSSKVHAIIEDALNSGFDYVLLDTRGGSDLTSVGSAIAAGSFILVTEADKTSWDVGKVLLDEIDEAAEELRGNDVYTGRESEITRLGFILNKNVLPSEAIETFLRRQWECPSLATIPLDKNAIRYFQEDIVPVSVDLACPFSISILPVVRKLFLSEAWNPMSLQLLEELEAETRRALKYQKRKSEAGDRLERFSFAVRLYGIVLSTLLLSYLVFIQSKEPDGASAATLGIVSAVLIFLMTAASDKAFLERLIERFLLPSSKLRNEKEE